MAMGEDGVPVYSDRQTPGAVAVNLPALSTGPGAAPQAPQQAPGLQTNRRLTAQQNSALRDIRNFRQEIQDQIRHGMTTTRRGQRLTADGLQGLVSTLNSLTSAEANILGSMAGLQGTQTTAAANLQGQQMTGDRALDQTLLQQAGALNLEQLRQQDPYRQAQTAALRQGGSRIAASFQPPVPPDMFSIPVDQQAAAMEQYDAQQRAYAGAANLVLQHGGDVKSAFDDVSELLATGDLSPEETQQMEGIRQYLAQGALGGSYVPIQGFADGGLVQNQLDMLGGQDLPESPPLGMAQMLPGMGAPDASMQQYQQYLQVARESGVEPVPFDEFTEMMAPQPSAGPPMPEMQQGAMGSSAIMGFADGGMVPGPDVSGQMVVDPDPNAPTDSIPAMIDGQQPAALDSGEFVIPADVVMHYGTEKLTKMIEKARGGDRA